MNTTYDVRIWPKIREYTSKKTKKTTYTVRWLVAGNEKHSAHESYALADAFRSDLVAASLEKARPSISRPASLCPC